MHSAVSGGQQSDPVALLGLADRVSVTAAAVVRPRLVPVPTTSGAAGSRLERS